MMLWQPIYEAVMGIGKTIIDAVDKFTLDPAEKLEAKRIVMEAQMAYRQQLIALEDQDRADARQREVQTGDPTTRRLAYVYTGGYFMAFVSLLFGWVEVQENMIRLVDVLMGVLTAGQYSIMSYYFGSSHGSSEKDKVMDRLVNHKEPAK
jgi:hypothetical protein